MKKRYWVNKELLLVWEEGKSQKELGDLEDLVKKPASEQVRFTETQSSCYLSFWNRVSKSQGEHTQSIHQSFL